MGHPSPEQTHPSLWTGSQLARATGRVIDTGYAALFAELPGGGWPVSTLIELLLQQVGVGEIRLLRPALWVERTPDDFTINIKAFGLFTGHGADRTKLPKDIQAMLPRALKKPFTTKTPRVPSCAFCGNVI